MRFTWSDFRTALKILPIAIVTGILGGIGLGAVDEWRQSQKRALILGWSDGRELWEIRSCGGKLYLLQHHQWWRQEPFGRFAEEVNGPIIPLKEWYGVDAQSSFPWAGFEFVRGEWTSHYIHVDETTKFTRPVARIQPGRPLMLRTTTPLDACAVPYWSIVLYCAIQCALSIAWMRQIERAASSSKTGV